MLIWRLIAAEFVSFSFTSAKFCGSTLNETTPYQFTIHCHSSLSRLYNVSYRGKGKGKIRPRTGHEGPDGERRYSSNLSLTSALDGSGWLTPRPGRFTPRGGDPVPIVQEAEWASRPVWMEAESLSSTKIRPPGCLVVASRYTDYAVLSL